MSETLTFQELQDKIARKVWRDPAFEAEFMADPKGTFEKYTGQKLPPELAIHAHYNSPTELHFAIPRGPAQAAGELTDEDLERVAGGEVLSVAMTVGLFAVTMTIGAAADTVIYNDW